MAPSTGGSHFGVTQTPNLAPPEDSTGGAAAMASNTADLSSIEDQNDLDTRKPYCRGAPA
jgi:hypothetical protein